MTSEGKNNGRSPVRELLTRAGMPGIIVVIIVLGIMLMLLPRGAGETDTATAVQETAVAGSDARTELEAAQERIAQALGQIAGAGRVTVLLTLKSDGETKLATDIRYYDRGEGSGREQTQDTVLVGAGGSVQTPIVVRRDFPEYRGALIIAEGAANAEIRLELLSAVATLTGLGTDRVSVAVMQPGANFAD